MSVSARRVHVVSPILQLFMGLFETVKRPKYFENFLRFVFLRPPKTSFRTTLVYSYGIWYTYSQCLYLKAEESRNKTRETRALEPELGAGAPESGFFRGAGAGALCEI